MNRLFQTVTTSKEEETVIPFQKLQDLEHKILIEELELNMSIGILPEEKIKKQRVIIDLEISLTPRENYEENINNTVSYAEIITDIETLTASKHFNLVETLAEEITTNCFKNEHIQRVKISVKKPDIMSNTKAVGFSMERVRESRT